MGDKGAPPRELILAVLAAALLVYSVGAWTAVAVRMGWEDALPFISGEAAPQPGPAAKPGASGPAPAAPPAGQAPPPAQAAPSPPKPVVTPSPVPPTVAPTAAAGGVVTAAIPSPTATATRTSAPTSLPTASIAPLLDLEVPYISESGLTVTVHGIAAKEEPGFNQYRIAYTLENKTPDKAIVEGTFKIYFEGGGAEPQYGLFDRLFPGESRTREYTWKVLKGQVASLIEFEGSFFEHTPKATTLKWGIPSEPAQAGLARATATPTAAPTPTPIPTSMPAPTPATATLTPTPGGPLLTAPPPGSTPVGALPPQLTAPTGPGQSP